MPSKKQRRRREKLKRHEWEFVQYDEDGNEIPVDTAQLRKSDDRPKQKPDANRRPQRKGEAAKRDRRPLREIKPPSWNRAAKRSLIFAPILYVFLSLGKNTPPVPMRIAFAVLYAVVFIPMFFFIDRMAYRGYQRRAGGSP